MLKIRESGQGMPRRDFLSIGGLGLGGLVLPHLLVGRSRAANSLKLVTGKSVIFLFQQGGPSQFETFDPKPEAPSGIRTVTGTIATRQPGIYFGEKMSRLAAVADKLTVVRSFRTNNGGHNIRPIVSDDSLDANIGVLYSRVVGAVRPESGMSTNTVLFPDAVCTDVLKGRARGDIAATGALGTAYAPFIPGAGGQLQRDMHLNLPRDRFATRQELVARLDALQSDLESSEHYQSLDDVRRQAYQVLLSDGVAQALDLSREDRATLELYDTADYSHADRWNSVDRGKEGQYTGHARALGRQLLLARRLCEAGCGFVTIHAGYDGVWDMHADGNNLNMVDGMEAVGPAFDHAVAAFVADVESRGLRDQIMLIATGEMGRTPRINRNGGRDHWGNLTPLLCYGGGHAPGQVIGCSTRDGATPLSDPLDPKHLVSTILHTLFDPGELRLVPNLSTISKLAEHPPIPGLG